ncbi:ATP-binding protein [Nocardioides sp. KR10-350]|uniref:AAA family ATPase n=1 Tax=Nocardioides cheoyonin TaxID=3156615 RepID=UPI0032B5F06D
MRLPSGPAGATRECLQAAVVLVTQGEERLAVLVMGSDPDEGGGVRVQTMATEERVARAFGQELRERALELNVYRGQVVSFGHDVFGERGSLLRFEDRPTMSADELILPEETFADLRRQVVGVARHGERLRRAGQHLKRGLLLYGPPGVGKTHSVRYLMSELVGTTVVELSGESLGALREACSVARSLQPAMIVVEDVDLIAQDRDYYDGDASPLFTLLNEMDGLDEDADVVFLLTTNRADLLEDALASRPGRVDQAVWIDRPDRDARRKLIELYRGRLDLDLSRLDGVLDRTEGVTASFLKELLRRAAVIAADRETGPVDGLPLHVSADDLDAAVDDLLDTRNQMTRTALGLRTGGTDADAEPDWDDVDEE